MRYIPTLRWTIALLAAWTCVILVGGHGITPLGALLFFGTEGEWRGLAVAGWGGVVLLLGGQRRGHRGLYAAGLVLLALVWGIALVQVELHLVTLLTSLPYCGLLYIQGRDLVAGEERDDAPSGVT